MLKLSIESGQWSGWSRNTILRRCVIITMSCKPMYKRQTYLHILGFPNQTITMWYLPLLIYKHVLTSFVHYLPTITSNITKWIGCGKFGICFLRNNLPQYMCDIVFAKRKHKMFKMIALVMYEFKSVPNTKLWHLFLGTYISWHCRMHKQSGSYIIVTNCLKWSRSVKYA